jgi:hypothetical protein
MKLANSWAEEAPTTIPSEQLYDESEEYDELDESQDGCGGVRWRLYVLQAPHTSYTMLLELARDVRGVEKRRGKNLTVAEYKTIHDKWAHASRPHLRQGHDYFTEFLSKLNSVIMPKGETLESAFQRAKGKQPPSRVSLVPNKGLQSLASLCRELQEMYGDQPIMLCQTPIAKLFPVSQQTISIWIGALKGLGVLRLAEPAIKNARAARYYFIEEAA